MMSRIFRGAFFGILLGIVGGITAGSLLYGKKDAAEDETAVLTMSKNIAAEEERETKDSEMVYPVLRFHVRANSDREEDQALKMEVKEQVLAILEPVMREADSLELAESLISAKLPYIKSQVEEYMQNAGFSYQAEVYFTTEYFPLKQYGDVTFPAGNYEALRVDIGQVKGQNWWCVMYPSLCFVDAAHAVLPLEEKEKLREVLTEEEYNKLIEGSLQKEASDGADSEDIWFYHSKLIDLIKEWIS